MNTAKKKIHYAWWILVSLCIFVGLGKGVLNNSAGLYLPPVSKDLGVGMGNLTLYLSISSVVTLVFLPFAGKMMAKYNTRFLLIIAIILQAGAFAAFGFMRNVWGWYIFAIPLAIGGVFITVIAGPILINTWFKKSNGLALGIMGAFVGAIGAIAQPIIGGLIAGSGWEKAYIYVGVAIIIISVPTILFMVKGQPKDKGLKPYGEDDGSESGNDAKADSINKGVTMAVAKKSSAFYALTVFFFLITAIASFSIHIPKYLTNLGYSVADSGSVMGAYMIGVLVGALLLGYLSDKLGAKLTSLMAMILGVIAIVLFLYFADVKALLYVAAIIFGLMAASIGTLAPTLTSALFGGKEYSQIYSSASLGLAVASIIALPVYGYVNDFTGSYTAVLYALIVMFIINIIAILIAFNGKKKLEDAGLWN